MTNPLAYVIPLVTIVGLIVLIALHDLTAADGLPLIGVLAGAHAGVAIATASNGGSQVSQVTPPVNPADPAA